MRLDDKRAMIDVLLCSRGECGRRIIDLADPSERDECYGKFEDVYAELDYDELDALGHDEYWHISTEAAYRLIESSPTLIREFFHRSSP